jgi:type VI secretion system secreted protein VgrG
MEFDDRSGAELLALRAAKDYRVEVEECATRTIGADEVTTVKGKVSRDVAETHDVTVGKGMTVEADSLAARVNKSSTQEAQSIEMTAQTGLTLKVGSSSIEMTPSGITLSAPKVDITSTGQATLNGMGVTVQADTTAALKGLTAEVSGDVKAKVSGGAQAEVSGSGMLTLKGGVVMIN